MIRLVNLLIRDVFNSVREWVELTNNYTKKKRFE